MLPNVCLSGARTHSTSVIHFKLTNTQPSASGGLFGGGQESQRAELHCYFTNVREQLAVNVEGFRNPPTLTRPVISLCLTLRVDTVIVSAP